MKRIWENVMLGVSLSLIIVGSYLLGANIGFNVKEVIPLGNSFETGCGNNLSLDDASLCLKQELEEFYYYNESNIGKAKTFEELKEEGGVCSHYSIWYVKQMKDLGFDAQYITFPTGEYSSHAIAIASDANGYCILDQRNVHCIHIGNNANTQIQMGDNRFRWGNGSYITINETEVNST